MIAIHNSKYPADNPDEVRPNQHYSHDVSAPVGHES